MAVQEYTYEHWLQMSVKVQMAVCVKVVGAPHLLLEPITIVNQDIMVMLNVLQSCTPVILSRCDLTMLPVVLVIILCRSHVN